MGDTDHGFETLQMLLLQEMQDAVNNRDLEIIKHLAKQGADIELKDNYNNSALMIATIGGDIDFVRLLIDKGADLEIKNVHHNTALQLAIRNKRMEILQVLIKAGAVIDKNDHYLAESCGFHAAAPLLREAFKNRETNAVKIAEKTRRTSVAEKQQILKDKAAKRQIKFKP
jgi:hypothetical protein